MKRKLTNKEEAGLGGLRACLRDDQPTLRRAIEFAEAHSGEIEVIITEDRTAIRCGDQTLELA